MIDWKVENNNSFYSEEEWFFPTFTMQEYLLPLINVGYKYIDEYNDTKFTREDCMRIKGNIEYLLNTPHSDRKKIIKYDTVSRGIETIKIEEIKNCLQKLYVAADHALTTGGILKFYGD